jgi:hypothetical protein
MKKIIQTTTFILLLASSVIAQGTPALKEVKTLPESYSSYSSILDTDGWDSNRLKEAGISVKKVDPSEIGISFDVDKGEANGAKGNNLVEISFDCSKHPKDVIVRMVLQVIGEDMKTISLHHAGRKEGDGNKLTMTFHVNESTLKYSYLTFLISEHPAKEDGSIEFGGYSLTVGRVIELARKDAAEKK